MDELAMFGALVVSGGGSSATIVTTDQLPLDQSHPPPEFSASDREASDAVFTAPPAKHPPSLAMTAMVVTAGVLALKATVLDEAHAGFDEEEPRKKQDEENAEGEEEEATKAH